MNDDVIFELYKVLPLKDILTCSLISKQFYRVTKNELLWKGKIKEVIKFDGSYYESFKFNYELEIVKIGFKYNGSINKLYHTTEFICYQRNIRYIPTQIGLLQNLQILDLEYNRLTTIPTQIGLLKNVCQIYLAANMLTYVPTEIGNMQNLNTLGLSYNKLTSLPTELGQLKNLKILWLYDNNVIIPNEILQIPNISIKMNKN
jgi:Leucine-rich repeat (LRR) protein